MKVKQAALLTALALSFGTISAIPTAYADSSIPQSGAAAVSKTSTAELNLEMTEAIKLVKSRIHIPEEYSEFSYSTSVNGTLNSYEFKWSKKDGSGSYRVNVTGGIIRSYYTPGSVSDPGFSPYSAEQLKNKALKWIYTVNPECKGNIVLRSGPRIDLRFNDAEMYFMRVSDGVRVYKNNIHITLDKMTGNVTSYECDWWEKISLPDHSSAVSENEIENIYKKDVSLKPWYKLTYDEETKKTVARAVYEPLEQYLEYDAYSGKRTSMYDDRSALQDTDLYYDILDDHEDLIVDPVEAGAGFDGPEALTPEELAAVTEQKGLLTEKQFRKLMIKDPYIKVTDKYLTQSYEISQSDKAESGYIINAVIYINNSEEYRKYDIQADAQSGSVYSFSCVKNVESKEPIAPDKANRLAVEAAKYYYGDVWEKYKADPQNTAPAVKTDDYTESSRDMKFYRYENNIQVQYNNISINVNSDGEVMSAYCNYTKDVDFGDGKIISPSRAFEKLFEQRGSDLHFDGFRDLHTRPHIYLIYLIDEWHINAVTGELCDSYGYPLKDSVFYSECPYTDIENSPYKKEIALLYSHSVRLASDNDSNKLEPKKAVTKEEVSKLLSYIGYRNNVDDEEKNSPVNKLQLAQMFTHSMGYDECAGIPGIFRSPFSDIGSDNENAGYVAIAYGLGFMDSDNDKFAPGTVVTREYALHCLYGYIVSNMQRNAE